MTPVLSPNHAHVQLSPKRKRSLTLSGSAARLSSHAFWLTGSPGRRRAETHRTEADLGFQGRGLKRSCAPPRSVQICGSPSTSGDFPNMRVPERSSSVKSLPRSAVGRTGHRDLAWWESSDGSLLPRDPERWTSIWGLFRSVSEIDVRNAP